MTMRYLGVHPESSYQGSKYQKKFSHIETHRGKPVRYYEVVEMEEVNVKVHLSAVPRMSDTFKLEDYEEVL